MDSRFIDKFRALRGESVTGLACGTVKVGKKTVKCFELQIGDQRICWEIEDGHGRCFSMDEDSVDGAGVFPLEEIAAGGVNA